MNNMQISTTASAGEQPGVSGSPVKNDDHLSPTSTGLELFPLKEEREKEVFNGDGSVFNITFSGPVEQKENGKISLQLNPNSDEIFT